jgi:hypothetical protein
MGHLVYSMPVAQQRRAARYIKRVGGYDEAARIECERRAILEKHPGAHIALRRDEQGTFHAVLAPELGPDCYRPNAFDFEGTIVLKAGDKLIPLDRVRYLSLEHIEQEIVEITTDDGEQHVAVGLDAIEIVLQLKPSALEGRRLRWRKGAWAWHNIVGHVGLQLLVWLGFKKAGIRLHDRTTPTMRDLRH